MTFRSSISRLTLAVGLTKGAARYVTPLALAAVLSVSASAQLAGKGSINGRIVDGTGAVVPDASVTITDVGTNKKVTVQTNSSGEYTFSLDPGKYTIIVSRQGFKTVTQENVNVNALQTFSVDLTLPTGEATESVTVSDAPPTLETSNATLGVTIEQEQYSALPLIQDGGGQRRATDFASLLPGVSAQVTNGNQTTNAGIVNGGGSRGAVSAIYINGVPITSVAGEGDPRFVWTSMAVDAIEQFQVQTVGYSAIYEGQGVQNYVVKRGTNSIHGAAYDYFRDTGLDTWGFQKTPNPLTGQLQKPTEHQHEYGLFVGFPIIKDKLFVFGGYEGYRFSRQVPFQSMTIPTLKMRQGDFTELATGCTASSNPASGCLYDPDTTTVQGSGYKRNGFAGNIIPVSRQSAVARRLQSYLPAPTTNTVNNNYLVNYKTGLSNWTTTNRIDYTINSKQALSVVLAWGRQSTTAPAAVTVSSSSNGMPPPYISSQQFAPKTKVFLFEHTYAITPRITNQINYAFGRYDGPGFNQDMGNGWGAAANGISGLPTGQAQDSFPTVTFTGNTNINRWAGYSSNRPVANGFVLVDNLQYNKGNHTFTFGAQIAWMQYNFLNNATGVNPLQLTFNSTATGAFTVTNNAPTTSINSATGQAYASYLIGAVNTGTFTLSAVPETGARFRPISPYVQDNWKITSKLTLDLGVRFDYFPSYREVKNRFAYFDPNATNPVVGIKGAVAFGGYGSGKCNCDRPVNDYFKGFSPRVGFAYQLDPKTVIRGSYSVIYTHGNANGGSATARQGVGLLGYSVSPSTTFTQPTSGQVGSQYWKLDTTFPSYAAPPNLDPAIGTYNTTLISSPAQTPSYADPNYGGRAPQFINWNFGIQRELTPSTTLTMSYVGSKGHFLQPDSLNGRGVASNQLDPKYLTLGSLLGSSASSASARASAGVTLPYASFGGVGNPTISQLLKPFPQYNSISDAYGFVGNTSFHALQIYITKRLTNGLTFMTNYQWSRTIDNNGTFRSGYDIPASVSSDGQFHAARSLDQSLSLGDQRHKFVTTGAYNLPFGTGVLGGGSRWSRVAFGGFRLSGIFTAYSGAPVSITMNSCNSNPSQNACYPLMNPNYVGNGRLQGVGARPLTSAEVGSKQFLDPNAFISYIGNQALYDYKFSTTARTAPYAGLFQPGNYKLDMSLRRAIDLPHVGSFESSKLVLEADYFNVTNHTRFVYSQSNAVLNTFGSSSYGTMVVDTSSPINRALQLAARIEF
ncbi:hypothetical protein FTW19_10195 [Terriglobus albidus]|uniref:TonB-dependent transporter Oar-like beta-barrel domain-containing protein n=1 Tax=Terriglobus albidus TaxID=1592106 RepID=A0A5B9EB12_9BACT|nr:TonB-dependent receptor [Terriglobus albidus]QEE28335.1 hypothetical protein FTW19_10195 [Terriglobus albidus]